MGGTVIHTTRVMVLGASSLQPRTNPSEWYRHARAVVSRVASRQTVRPPILRVQTLASLRVATFDARYQITELSKSIDFSEVIRNRVEHTSWLLTLST